MNADRILAESSTVLETEFWKFYHQKIAEQRAVDSRACETKEVVSKFQGAVMAWDFILGRGDFKKPLAERILDELENKGEK